ncbi:hypothetical protein [Halomicrococcus sp. SG-WS-1]|uniref:hypothetical protein n=1 Tax=Halomicrococcus sp. SG-WS-1 TaxID=3439057 RepID=UPI003F78B4AA
MYRKTDRISRRDVLRTSLLLGGSLPLATNGGGALEIDDEPAFYDDWEDGDYTSNPGWRVYDDDGDFRARVRSQSTPEGGRHVLQIRETTGGGTDGIIGWRTGLAGWEDEWTLSGSFYTQNVPLNSDFQGHNVILYDDPDENHSPLKVHLGFVDSRGRQKPFLVEGDLVDSVQKTDSVDWQEDIWYHYEVKHDGDGTYLGRLWEDGTGRPSTPNARSVGSPPNTEKRFASLQINGAHYRAFDINHSFMEWQAGTRTDDPTASLEQLIDRKSEKIDAIQGLAAQTIGEDEANSTVDQSAQELLAEIREDGLETSTEQYERALNRMNATESVTETSTRAVVGEDNPTEKTSENVYSFATGAAIELIPEVGEKIGAGILKRINASILDDVTGFLDDITQSIRGSGALPTSSLNDIDADLNAYKISQASRSESAIRNNKDNAREAVNGAAGGTLKAGELAYAATNPDAKQNLLDSLEETLFETYYFAPDLPSVDVPVPSNIDLPDFEVSYDVPDEELPSYLRGTVPDSIDIDTTDLEIQLTEAPVLEEISALLDTYQDDVKTGGINTTIDARMEYLHSNVSSLSAQDADTRETLQSTAADAIQAVETLLNDILIDGLEKISDVLSLAADLASAGSVAALVGAAFLIVTGFGAATALGLAGTLATVATALSVAALFIDSVQIASGFGFAMIDNEIHQTATYLLGETDLSGVNL